MLLPFEEAGASAVTSADYEAKATYFRECGAEELFPAFTGGVSAADGKYARHKFSFEDCQLRHVDIMRKLIEIFDLR